MSKLLSLGKSFLLCTVTCTKYVYCKNFLFILASYHCCCNKTLIRREAQDIWPRVSQDEDTGGIFALFPSCSQQKSRILFLATFVCRSPHLVLHLSPKGFLLYGLVPMLSNLRLFHRLRALGVYDKVQIQAAGLAVYPCFKIWAEITFNGVFT